ncbi:MAG: CHAT domain-containing protein [Candidatus Binataceae bacterium]
MILSDLGTALSTRAAARRNIREASEAIHVLESAVKLTPANSPFRAIIINGLGVAWRVHFNLTKDDASLKKATTVYRDAAAAAESISVVEMLRIVHNWGDWAFDRLAWTEASEAYSIAIGAMHRLTRGQLLREDKERILARFSDVPARFAFAEAELGRVEGAVEAFEAGRALLMSEALDLQETDFAELAATRPDLFKRYSDSVSKISGYRAVSRPAAEVLQGNAPAKLEKVVAEIRRIPGYEGFLKTVPFDEVVSLSRQRPIVYLAATPRGGFALIVRAEKPPSYLHLSELTTEELRARESQFLASYQSFQRDGTSSSFFETLDDLTIWLWHIGIGAVVDELSDCDSVWIVAGGLLGCLPIHAAWANGERRPSQRRYASDHLAFAYLPNVRSAVRRPVRRAAGGLSLIVEQPQPITGAWLAGAAAEAAFVRSCVASETLAGHRATRDAVLAALAVRRPVLHFSGHAAANPLDPLQSGFLVAHDLWVTVGDLIKSRCEIGLAVISGCETGMIGLSLPDEAIGLPVGLVQGGASTVVATLWEVQDDAAFLIMSKFYELRSMTADDAAALRNAQMWLRAASCAELKAYLSSLPSTVRHRLKAESIVPADGWGDELKCPFEHPFYWAAFQLVGSGLLSQAPRISRQRAPRPNSAQRGRYSRSRE